MNTICRFLVLGALLGAVGCGGDPRRGITLQGTVTLDTAPLTRGQVVFTAQRGDVVRQGDLQTDGAYTVLDIPPGEYKVTVRPVTFSEDDYEVGPKGKKVPKPKSKSQVIPKTYQEVATTPLIVQVRSGQALPLALTTP